MPDSATSVSGYLLSLAALHAATPGSPLTILRGVCLPLSCEGTEYWRALWADDCLLIWPRHGRTHGSLPWVYGLDDPSDRNHSDLLGWLLRFSLDVSNEQTAGHLAGLCARAGYPDLMFQDNEVIAQARYGGPSWNEAWAVRLAALTLALAPRIAALRQQR